QKSIAYKNIFLVFFTKNLFIRSKRNGWDSKPIGSQVTEPIFLIEFVAFRYGCSTTHNKSYINDEVLLFLLHPYPIRVVNVVQVLITRSSTKVNNTRKEHGIQDLQSMIEGRSTIKYIILV
ncbi:hypothetical protein AABB24_026329, partial [Solanum stoloniferum]